jgi:hypothetical protein
MHQAAARFSKQVATGDAATAIRPITFVQTLWDTTGTN